MSNLQDWRAVQMGSEGWAVFGPLGHLPQGHCIASNLTEEDAKLIASAPGLQQRVEALEQELETLKDAATELIVVATLRGDNDLPHPANDSKHWTARMRSAWDELEALAAAQDNVGE